ncbi:imidazolonepropionase [Natronococcus jeotgali]|uniref:Imidazolonepropionase n=1 Tax=Natronococcus jeotgali DSM 18795 TaxID=1227498 RepID=L9XF81_9EURY|nr:imidazolonepropionase [Natronococcus jeotgali]ELY59338.1 imidazolonepropionase [Natronococcus jeotgali DSM 18795]
MSYTIVYDANELVTGPANSAETNTNKRTGDGSSDSSVRPVLNVESNAAIVIEGGTVAAIDSSDKLTREYPTENATTAIDASGQCVLPGFVDPHTHAVFAGDRSDEFEAKLRGKSYQEILAEGGGILRTVQAVREASVDELTDRLLERLNLMLAAGTTTAEIKSGYGLDTETELKLLSAINRADERHPIDIVATFMGAHAIPEGVNANEYTTSVVEEQLPAVEKQGIAEFCDVFCEAGVFSVEQSRKILEAGTKRGLTPKLHIDEFENLGGSQLAASLSAASADHLLQSTPEDIETLLEADVTPVLLPGTAFGLGGEYPSLEPYRKRNIIPAIGSDFNPNCYAKRMGFAATLACVGIGMTPGEAIRGITDRSAAAINRSDSVGTLEIGDPADLAVLEIPSYRHLPYRYDENVVGSVLKHGDVVVETSDPSTKH